MYINSTTCDLYIGKGAGKKIMTDIRHAKSSVKIVSPFLSPSLIKKLINLKERGIEVSLITADEIEDFYGSREKNIYKLINQNRRTDKEALQTREKWRDIAKKLLYAAAGLFVILAVLFYFMHEVKLAFGLVPILILLLIYNFLRIEINKKRIYNYSYSTPFPLKVYLSADKENKYNSTYLHSKMYIIDDKIAYLGSLNFTKSGTKYNHETRVRTTDKRAVEQMNNEIADLFEKHHIPKIDIQKWGRKLYAEPIN